MLEGNKSFPSIDFTLNFTQISHTLTGRIYHLTEFNVSIYINKIQNLLSREQNQSYLLCITVVYKYFQSKLLYKYKV